MTLRRAVLSASACIMGFATPATAVTVVRSVSFTEAATDGGTNPVPTVTGFGITDFSTSVTGEASQVTLINFFGQNSDGQFPSFFNLLEPGTTVVSDQIVFSQNENNLIINFISDPAQFLTGRPYGSASETGQSQSITLPQGVSNLTITATSDLDSAVPEPASWALMMLGFGGMGMALRRGRARNVTLGQIA